MFKQGRNVNILPSVGADSIEYYVSLMIAWRVQFWALWDNDEAGRNAKQRAEDHFGQHISERHFFLLPSKGDSSRKRILQDLFAGSDLRMIKEALGIPLNSIRHAVTNGAFANARLEPKSGLK